MKIAFVDVNNFIPRQNNFQCCYTWKQQNRQQADHLDFAAIGLKAFFTSTRCDSAHDLKVKRAFNDFENPDWQNVFWAGTPSSQNKVREHSKLIGSITLYSHRPALTEHHWAREINRSEELHEIESIHLLFSRSHLIYSRIGCKVSVQASFFFLKKWE